MKLKKRIGAFLLAGAMIVNILAMQTVYAVYDTDTQDLADVTSVNEIGRDMYAEGLVEDVNIQGVDYTYHYFYEDGNKTIAIVNEDGSVDTIKYEENGLSTVAYLNGEVFGTITKTLDVQVVSLPNSIVPNATDWVTIGNDSVSISWKAAATAREVATIIAEGANTLIGMSIINAATVTAWIGGNVLAALADAAGGGSVNVKTQRFYAPPATPVYRYLISFKHRNRKTYGPFIYTQ